jgi:hypothetical protein
MMRSKISDLELMNAFRSVIRYNSKSEKQTKFVDPKKKKRVYRRLMRLILSTEFAYGERYELARYVAGRYRRDRGNPIRVSRSEKARKQEAVQAVKATMRGKPRVKLAKAIELVAASAGVDERQVASWYNNRNRLK